MLIYYLHVVFELIAVLLSLLYGCSSLMDVSISLNTSLLPV
jgi:hypothetical protein